MRVSGERQRNSRNASPENFVSAMNGRHAGQQQHDHRPRREMHQQHRKAQQRDRRSAPSRRCASPGSAGGSRPRGAPASACRRTQNPRTAAARSVSAFSRIITLTRWPSCARSNAWHSDSPRCTPDQRRDQQALEQHEPQHQVHVVPGRVHRGHHGIDDPRADPGDCRPAADPRSASAPRPRTAACGWCPRPAGGRAGCSGTRQRNSLPPQQAASTGWPAMAAVDRANSRAGSWACGPSDR